MRDVDSCILGNMEESPDGDSASPRLLAGSILLFGFVVLVIGIETANPVKVTPPRFAKLFRKRKAKVAPVFVTGGNVGV